MLKIVKDKEFFKYIEKRIRDDNYEVNTVIGEVKKRELPFLVMVCTKTIYNMIDRGDFCRITNRNLPIKRNKSNREYRRDRKFLFSRRTEKTTLYYMYPYSSLSITYFFSLDVKFRFSSFIYLYVPLNSFFLLYANVLISF